MNALANSSRQRAASLAQEYERIRCHVIAHTAQGPGYGLILRRGVAAWMEVAVPWAADSPQTRLACAPLPGEGELVRLLAALVLSGRASTARPSSHAKHL